VTDWSYKSWVARVSAVALATCMASGVVGCSKKKPDETKAKAEKAEAKKKPQGDRYADGVRLAAAQKEWTKRWAENTDLPACEPLLKVPAELTLCKDAQAALVTMKAAVAKPEPEAVLIHAAAELSFASEAASERLRNAYMEKTQAEHKPAGPVGSGAPAAKAPGFSALPRTRPVGSAGKAGLADKLKGVETAPLDPNQQLMQAYARVNRASLRYLSQFLQFGPLPTRNATFTELESLSRRKELWPALGRTLREAAMTENDPTLQGKLKELAPKLSRRGPGGAGVPMMPGMPPGHPAMPEPGTPPPAAPAP
jgi:hypothetical protein